MRGKIGLLLAVLLVVLTAIAACGGGGGGSTGSTGSTDTGACVQVSQGNSTVKVVNSTNSMIQVYFGTSVAFGADLAPGVCNLVGIQLPSSYTLQTQVEITQCTPAAGGGCGAKFGTTKYVSLTLPVGQTQTISVDSNFFTSSGGNTNTTYSMSGTVTANGVALSGVTMTLSGAGSGTATTDSSGNFTFTSVANGNYTVTPLKTGYTFSPSSLVVGVIGLNEVGVNFTATTTTASTYSIVGRVTVSGSGLSGVTLTLSGSGTGSATTDSSGNYTITGVANGTYTVTPSKSGYTFTPTSLSVTVSGANQAGQNFTATAVTPPNGGTWTLLKLPDTGQSICYNTVGTVIACSGTGQDGAYTLNPLSYTDNNNGTITDNVTGLVWQKQDDATMRPWANADTYCSSNTAGLPGTGWHLPGIMELSTIVDSSKLYPAINATYFPNTKFNAYYWSSTMLASDPFDVWSVDFGNSFIKFNNANQTDSEYVRCVRGGKTAANAENFTDNGSITVSDANTGFVWQKDDGGTTRTWAEALTYCEGLSLAGQIDWRLPNRNELMSIVDYTRSSPAINTTYFPNAEPSYYWTSTSFDAFALFVDFGYGDVYEYYNGVGTGNKSNFYYVRCVRGGL